MAIECGGWICPLTPLENYLREQGGASGCRGDVVEHYVLPALYPARLTRDALLLGLAAVLFNALV